MLDDLARYNKACWEKLAEANVVFSRPWLDLDVALARRRVDPERMMGEIAGKDVLCLAGGGGQQSSAFALLGARVTVIDLCETQLARDREAAEHYGIEVQTFQGDMRDLSRFADDSFDLVWHAHSLNFVPHPRPVFKEVARVLRTGGKYRLHCTNPIVHGNWEAGWNGKGYSFYRPYVDGAEIIYDDPEWDFDDGKGGRQRVRGPREFRHTLATLVNGLIAFRFSLLGMWEANEGDLNAEPGSWEHFQAVAPAWLILWAEYQS